jgi:ParB-like chromosome segregation protein Spo0J
MKQTTDTPEIHCKHTKLVPIEDLRPHPQNPNGHPDKQIALLAKNIRHLGWRHPIIVSELTGFVVAGHARIEAAKLLNLASVPVDFQPFASETEERAYLVADNRIAELAEIQNDAIQSLLAELDGEGLDMDLTGFDSESLIELSKEQDPSEPDQTYTNKIVAPVYEPKGDNPPIESLIDREKTDRLQKEIDEAGLPQDVTKFLKDAAERHTVFHFGRIAEWYCHATPQIQDLMEKSGMVIIDFDKAIEYGFVHMTERLGALLDMEDEDA